MLNEMLKSGDTMNKEGRMNQKQMMKFAKKFMKGKKLKF